MTRGERVREVRKALGLTLEQFGEKIGMKKNSISQIENNKNKLIDSNIKAICREFNVDYLWLTTGKGEMFIENDNDTIALIDRIMAGENEFHKNLMKSFARLNENDLLVLEKLLDGFISSYKENATCLPDTDSKTQENS